MTILVGEDDLALPDLIGFALRREGHDVIAVRDRASILGIWKSIEPELVLLDAKLPTVNGWDVSREIRRGSETRLVGSLPTPAEHRSVVAGSLYHAVIIVTDGESFRMKEARSRSGPRSSPERKEVHQS
jgi:DNA-binding response OmpR family regulator